MIHEKGIFVFESKNYSGWIFGSAYQLNWTQSLQNGEKHHFYNPIRQNQTHIKALSAYLNIPTDCFMSYIVFSERCSLKQIPDDTDRIVIVRRPNMLKKLRAQLNSLMSLYSHEDIQHLAQVLQPLTNKSESEKHSISMKSERNVLFAVVNSFCVTESTDSFGVAAHTQNVNLPDH